jgi:hypothetical protein
MKYYVILTVKKQNLLYLQHGDGTMEQISSNRGYYSLNVLFSNIYFHANGEPFRILRKVVK